MEVIIFIVLLAIALILFIAAEYLDVVLHVAAFGILFILGMTILLGGLEFKSGEDIYQNFTFLDDNTTVNQTWETRTAVYTPYDSGYSHILGFILAASSVLGFALVYVHYGRKRKEEGEDFLK